MSPTFPLSQATFVGPGTALRPVPTTARDYAHTAPPTPRSASLHRDRACNALVETFRARIAEGDPVSDPSFCSALRLIDALPPTVPDPDIGVDPDGEVALEWYTAPRQTLSISVGHDAVLRYAALLGDEATAGTARLDGAALPAAVLGLVRRALARS